MLSRRYLLVVIFLCLCLFLWHNFPLAGYEIPNVGSGLKAGGGGKSSIRYVASTYDWSQNQIFYPVQDMKSPPSGSPLKMPPVQTKTPGQDDHSRARKAAIKKAFTKSWDAYKAHAWGQDELMPLSGKGKQSLSGWSAQLVDALDTLWIMDLKEDFHKAVEETALIDWARTGDLFLNTFEVIIRHLGGLISAYDLSGEPALLSKAVELGDMLYAAYDTPNRLPTHWLYFDKAKIGKQLADEKMSGAAGCSASLEFTRLSQITGDPKYYDATERVKQFLYRKQDQTRLPGMWPKIINYRDETMHSSAFSIGAGADSLYEYLPKMHALLGGLDPQYVEMTVKALETVKNYLLYRPMTPKDENILMAGNAMSSNNEVKITFEMQHLTCFTGGMYALAGKLLEKEDYVDLGKRLTAGCVFAYDSFDTNIMPETCEFNACDTLDGPCTYNEDIVGSRKAGLPDGFVKVSDTRYLLRPEAIESVFYMWRITGDQTWRDAAWRMWEGIVKETETPLAFAAISDVRSHGSTQADSMEVSSSLSSPLSCKRIVTNMMTDVLAIRDSQVLLPHLRG